MDQKAKTSFSVPELQRMLGMGKTNSYWLLKKGYFDTVVAGGKIRVLCDSFEAWYENQTHYKKVKSYTGGEQDGLNY